MAKLSALAPGKIILSFHGWVSSCCLVSRFFAGGDTLLFAYASTCPKGKFYQSAEIVAEAMAGGGRREVRNRFVFSTGISSWCRVVGGSVGEVTLQLQHFC
jgi:hypothetical protein